jgi:hypothetical protein
MRRFHGLRDLRVVLLHSSSPHRRPNKSRSVRARRSTFELLEARRLLTVDYGDAPDLGMGTGSDNYNTFATDNGPGHTIVAGLRMGPVVDNDSGTLQNAGANADDADGALPDDEDGLVNPAADLALTIGTQPTVNVRVTNSTGSAATLHGWIDYNANGVFDNATERASIAVPNGSNNTTVTLVFPAVPQGFSGSTYARFRLSTDTAAANPTGPAADGEIEDHVATIVNISDVPLDPAKTKLLANQTNGVPALGVQSNFGRGVTSLGDLDGDGVTDMAVGASGSDFVGVDRGAVYVLFMNPNGTVKDSQLIAHNYGGGPTLSNGNFFGVSTSSIGDLDGDGVTDLAVGANLDAGFKGALYILFLNRDGTAKAIQKITDGSGGAVLPDSAQFGVSVTPVGDLDGDGVTDLAVGANGENNRRGAVYVLFMNGNGTVKNSQRIASGVGGGPTLTSGDYFGFGLASLGDMDGDGVTDLAAGAPGNFLVGGGGGHAVYVLFLNANGTVKSSQKIARSPSNFRFGSSVASLGDINGDGVTDLAVASQGRYSGGVAEVLLLNSDGTVKSAETMGTEFGISMASLGDLDGDGLTDLALGVRSLQGVYVAFMTPRNTNPVITSSDSPSISEHSTFVLNVTATDPNTPPRAISFSLVGGADQSKFAITSGGALSFIAAPDFEMPMDANGNNVYEVVVQASNDIGGSATQMISVLVVQLPFDSGDAIDPAPGTGPGNYNTLATDNGPRHSIVSGLRIGDAVGSDTGMQQNAAADADPNDDGVIFPENDLVMTIGAQPSVFVRATNEIGSPAMLYGWIDFNADGVFDNSSERASVAVPTGFTAGFTLVFPNVPSSHVGTTYARFRLSTDPAAADPTGEADDGEVEDYRVTIMRRSTGEADSNKTKKIGSGIGGGPPLANNEKFGTAVAAIPDLNGDGIRELIVGAPSQTGAPSSGSVYVLQMNASGNVASSTKITSGVNGGPTLSEGDYFGHSVAAIGDLDGDGIQDLAVGATKDDTGGYISGAVYILFRDGRTQKIASGSPGGVNIAAGDRFGSSVASLGDLDGDGITDLAVGAISDDTGGNYRGAVHLLFMNKNGTVKLSQKIASGIAAAPTLADSDMFGVSVASLGDLDGDGVTDLAVGAFRDDTGGNGRGAVYILFMNSGGTVRSHQKIASGTGGGPTLTDQDYFGRSVASLGDLDGDGVMDIAVGAYRDDTGGSGRGALHVLFLNTNGTVKANTKIANATGGGPNLVDEDHFGSGVTSLGDVDGDAVVDLVVGAETDHTVGTNRGAVHVLFLKPVAGLSGDYNDDGTVDAADYVTWRRALGQLITLPNDSTPGTVTQEDYGVWRANFGRTAQAAGSSLMSTLVDDSQHLQSGQATVASVVAATPRIPDNRATSNLSSDVQSVSRSVRRGDVRRMKLHTLAAPTHDEALVAWLAATSELARDVRVPSFNPGTQTGSNNVGATSRDDALDVAFASLASSATLSS